MKQASTRLLSLTVGLLLTGLATQAQVTPAPAPGNLAAAQLARLQRPSLPAGAPALRPGARLTEAAGKRGISARALARPSASLASRPSARLDQSHASTTETVTQAGVIRHRVPAGFSFSQTAMAVDAAGNTYLTGTTRATTSGSTEDYLTVKYSPSGQLLWERRADGQPANRSNDRPRTIAVDAAGNVVVTGSTTFSPGSVTFTDFLTVMYSPSGETLWTAQFSQGDFRENATDLAVDAAGNVYVTGTSSFSIVGRDYQFVTVKYSPTGQQLWATTRALDLVEDARFIAVDARGDVFVCGSSTIKKYAGATGQTLWTVRNAGDIRDILVDATGDLLTSEAPSTNSAIVKYAGATGQRLWQAPYQGPATETGGAASLALDAAGNVYATGTSRHSSTAYDLVTLKYSASGQQLWQAHYNSPGSTQDSGTAILVDAAGNVYVAGQTNVAENGRSNTDFLTLKYSPTGQPLWQIRYNGPRNGDDYANTIQLNGAGNVYVGGSTDSNVAGGGSQGAVLKYEQGSVQPGWEARFTGPGSSAEVAKDVVSDAAGNVYVTGYAYNGRNYDYATVKYDATGQQLWEARYNGPADNEDLPTNVVIDAAGNVYVSGTSYSASESDYATIKYSPSGQQLWVVRYNGPASGYDLASKVAIDAASNVLVTGSSDNGSNGSYDYATVKYDANGQQQWATRYNGPDNSYDLAADLVVDAAGNAYVTGTTYTDTQSDYATLKYDGANGQPVWEARYSGPGAGYDEAAKLALADPQQTSVVVTGTSDGGGSTGFDIATAAYNADSGQAQWTYRYNGPQSGDDVVADLVTGRDGYAYVVGTAYSSTGADYATHVLANGQLQWAALYNGPANSYDEAKAIAVDAAGDAYVTGLSFNSDGTDDYATVKYAFNPNPSTPSLVGRQLWSARYDGAGSYDEAAALTVDSRNNVYVTGYSLGTDSGYDFTTLQYTQHQDGGLLALPRVASLAAARAPLAAASSRLLQQELSVYPNPASGPATVRFRPGQEGMTQVRVYNQLGQQVALLYEGPARPGQVYEFSLPSDALPAGLYTCSLLVGSQRASVRLVVTH